MQMLLVMILMLSSVGCETLIDLSHPYEENSRYWVTEIPFRFIKKEGNSDKGYWYAANQFETAEHCGTHIDAPYHFNKFGWKLHEIPLSRLITTGVFLNASSETNGNCSFMLTTKELEKWECENGKFPNNSILLISFGWASKYENKTEYMGPDGKLCFPGLSKEASEWITNSEKIVGVGVDTASIDQGSNVQSHIILNSKNVFIIENVALNPFIPLPSKFNIFALPMKIMNGTGGPCRLVAVT